MSSSIRSLIILLCCLCSVAVASNKVQQDSLSTVTQKLQKWQQYLTGHEKQRQQLQTMLKQQDTVIANSKQKVNHLNRQIKQQQTLLARLTREQSDTETRLSEQRELLRQQLRSTFLLSQPSTLKLLLNSDDVNNIGRQLTLYRILLQKRTGMLEHLQISLDSLETTKHDIAVTQHELQDLRKHALSSQHQLYHENQQRKRTLTKLQQEIRSGHAKIAQLKREKQALEQVISNLRKAPSEPGRTESHISMSSFKHRLAWPIAGGLLHRYGERITTRDMFWHGLVINAAEGKPVKAIFPGKVIFANWLQGFGFTLIVDHGHGYMSLYARNQDLAKAEGDSVASHETIAHAGKSGGFPQSSLYFELRHNGTPVDPLDWLKNN